MSGVAEVQARMATLQARMATLTPARVGTSSTDTSGFAQALSQAADEASPTGAAGSVQEPASSRPGGPTGSDVVAAAKKYLGVPYVWGGEDLSEGGLDCSGLVQRSFKDLGVQVSRTTQTQSKEGTAVPSMAQAKPGDLLFFENNSGRAGMDHVAIYVGGGKMIAAPKRGDVVKIQNVYATPDAIRRIVPSGPSATTASAASAVAPRAANTTGSGPWGKYHDLFTAAAARHGVPARLLGAVATVENATGNPKAVSPAGAVGVMQFMPATAKRFGIDPTDPAQSIDGGARYLSLLLRQFGSVDLAVAAYNAGEGNVRKYDGIPPFKETQNYVSKVRETMGRIR